MDMTDKQFSDHKTLVIPCDCAGGCSHLVIDRWDVNHPEDDEFYADIYTVPRKFTMRIRLRNAWRSLLGQPTYEPGMVIGVDQAREMRDWLDARLKVEA